jgi:hypothetical protein
MVVFLLIVIAVGVLLISEPGQALLVLILQGIMLLFFLAIALVVIAVVVGLLIWGISSLS